MDPVVNGRGRLRRPQYFPVWRSSSYATVKFSFFYSRGGNLQPPTVMPNPSTSACCDDPDPEMQLLVFLNIKPAAIFQYSHSIWLQSLVGERRSIKGYQQRVSKDAKHQYYSFFGQSLTLSLRRVLIIQNFSASLFSPKHPKISEHNGHMHHRWQPVTLL